MEVLDRRIDGEADEGSEMIVVVEEGARVVNSRIVGPVVIGADTVVEDSLVRPFTSVAENCRIADSEAGVLDRAARLTPAPSIS